MDKWSRHEYDWRRQLGGGGSVVYYRLEHGDHIVTMD